MTRKLTAVTVLAAASVALIAALGIATASVASAGGRAGTMTHFAGFPPVGVEASTPTTGTLVAGLRLGLTEWNVYASGRIIWQKWTPSGDATAIPSGASRLDTGFVQQRVTSRGVQLLRSKILATGLFEHNLRLIVGGNRDWVFARVRRGDRIVTVQGLPSADSSWKEQFTKATPDQLRALAWLGALVADPARWLSTSFWADRRIRAFVPARYLVAFDRGYPDTSKLPAPAGKALSRFEGLRRHGAQIVTTGRARELLQALAEAGISPSDNHAWNIGFALGGLPGQPRPSYLHLSPAIPGG